MILDCYIVDTFSAKVFCGNPAGVIVSDSDLDKAILLKIANELGVGEIAFLVISGNQVNIRWFTPSLEINLCGHATLASAHVLWENEYVVKEEDICFSSYSGNIKAKYEDGWIELDFPSDFPNPIESNPIIEKALGHTPVYTGKTKTDFFVVLSSEEDVLNLVPNIPLIASLPSEGLIVTSLSANNEYDFVSRVFAPNCGLDEDPVCGLAHSALGSYWSSKIGREVLRACQLSSRGGFIKVKIVNDRVCISGQAKTFLKGHIQI